MKKTGKEVKLFTTYLRGARLQCFKNIRDINRVKKH